MRKWIPKGNHGRMIRSRGVLRKSGDFRNLARNLGRQAESVCVTWLIFELENTSGANYIFILERSSTVEAVATLRRYGSNDGRL
jgi:hypothetical protein